MLATLQQAAAELHTSPRNLRRWVRAGAPIAQLGKAGRGHAARFDIEALRAWRTPAERKSISVQVLAAELPELIATAAFESFKQVSGPHKRDAAGVLAGSWFVTTSALLDYLRTLDPDVPELETCPQKVDTLRQVFAQSNTVDPSPSPKS